MNFHPSETKVYLVLGMTDMRKSINGLSLVVEDQLGMDLFSGSLFGVSSFAYLLFVTERGIW